MQDLNSDCPLPTCSCSSSPYIYQPAGHVVSGDLNIVKNTRLRELLHKGPKYREPQAFTWRYNFKIIMESVEAFARDWTKQEEVEVDTLSEWVKSIRRLLQRRIYMVCRQINTKPKSIFRDPDVTKALAFLHDQYVPVPADKASNNIVFVCKHYYYKCLIEEVGLVGHTQNPTYERSNFTRDEIISNHKPVMTSFGLSTKDCDLDLPNLYWIPIKVTQTSL